MTDATILLAGLEERVYERRGARIRTFEGGAGPPLLLVHGFGGAAWNFSELAPLLGTRRLIVPDLPGHGGSSPLPAPTLTGFADVLAELLDEPATAPVVDLMEALKASVAAASAKESDAPKKKAAPRKRAAASK